MVIHEQGGWSEAVAVASLVRPSGRAPVITLRVDTMKHETETTDTRTAHGKPLPAPIPYTFSWDVYENTAEQKAANDMLSDGEQLKARNAQKKANARTKALNAALEAAGIEKPTIENDDLLRLKTVYKGIVASKKHSDEKARELALLGAGLDEWPEDFDPS